MKKILYIGRFWLPDTAPGLRVYHMGRLYQAMGNQVEYLCLDGAPEIPQGTDLNGFHYTVVHRASGKKVWLNILDLYTGWISYRKVKQKILEYKPDVVVLYDDIGYLTKYLSCLRRKYKFILGADVTEWYEISHAVKHNKHIAKMTNKRIVRWDDRLDYAVVISPYLQDYYNSCGRKTYCIPPLMDSVEVDVRKHYQYEDGAVVNLGYAGSPGKKDAIIPILNAIKIINSEKIQIHLDLIGVSREDIECSLDNIPYEKYGIYAYGRLPRNKTLKILRRADYTFLLRENLRYAKAGFSTKFAESLSLGVPVICNRVGGADTLLEGNNAGVLLADYEVDTLLECFESLIKMSENEIIAAKQAALNIARENFLLKNYLQSGI